MGIAYQVPLPTTMKSRSTNLFREGVAYRKSKDGAKKRNNLGVRSRGRDGVGGKADNCTNIRSRYLVQEVK